VPDLRWRIGLVTRPTALTLWRAPDPHV